MHTSRYPDRTAAGARRSCPRTTLAAQPCNEFRTFFPDNAVHRRRSDAPPRGDLVEVARHGQGRSTGVMTRSCSSEDVRFAYRQVAVPHDDEAILARARSIPPGRVTTYGDVCPGAPRRAGAVLSACDDPTVPWQRVVRADGSLAQGERQRRLLEAEKVPFRGARVNMREAWMPPHG